jgi:GGDEF domain-containing protein
VVVRIRDAIRQPIDIGDRRTVTVGVSAGVALRPAGGDAVLHALTAEADAGMYSDKRGRTVAA